MVRPNRLLPLLLSLFALFSAVFGQGTIKGRVFNGLNNEPVGFAVVLLQNTQIGGFTDSLGNFELRNIPSGLYNLEVRYSGFRTEVVYEIQVTNSRPYVAEVSLKEADNAIDSVLITASPFKQSAESPLSLRTIGSNEIQRNPGGNRDISRVIQSLPGVASTPSFRNDILIRGGGPNENRFYIDGIEIPNINHFATQGASGGPVGLLNVDFIGEVDFYSGAFPANRGNALSSVFEFRQREARDDRLGFTATVGPSDLALTLEGPTSENSSFLFSARRSYLQLLFKVLGLPFLPTYNDFQFKHKTRFGTRHELTFVGLGAIDQFALNLEADSTPSQKYLLDNLPVQTQWNYAVGVNYKYFGDNGFWTVVGSRNMINFRAFKYPDNNETVTPILDYTSQESENKFRAEYAGRAWGFRWNYGVNYEFARYFNDTYNVLPFGIVDFESTLLMHKFGGFGQVSRTFFDERLTLSTGVRMDGNNFSKQMAQPWRTLSPRFSASYYLTSQLSFNFNTGIFYQLPPYTVLGFRDNGGLIVNKDVKYIRTGHLVGGFSYVTSQNLKIAIEGYYKDYSQYPFLLRDSISLANLGGDFGAIGNEPAVSTSEGRSYGLEVLLQQRLFKGFYGILAYTLGKSEFQDKNGSYVPSTWDGRHILTLTAGKKWKGNWETGIRWRLTTGQPFTPVDTFTTSLISVWDTRLREVPDYSRLNSQRLGTFHQLDIRVDKKWFFQKWSLNLYLDVQNTYGYQIPGPPIYTTVLDENDRPIPDPLNPDRYQMQWLENGLGIVQPTVGIIIQY